MNSLITSYINLPTKSVMSEKAALLFAKTKHITIYYHEDIESFDSDIFERVIVDLIEKHKNDTSTFYFTPQKLIVSSSLASKKPLDISNISIVIENLKTNLNILQPSEISYIKYCYKTSEKMLNGLNLFTQKAITVLQLIAYILHEIDNKKLTNQVILGLSTKKALNLTSKFNERLLDAQGIYCQLSRDDYLKLNQALILEHANKIITTKERKLPDSSETSSKE